MLHSGPRIAVEVQYAGLSVEAWEARTNSYRSLGITPVWIWGHVGAHSPLQSKWRDIAVRLLAEGQPVIWINPSEERIAWAFDMEGLLEPPGPPGAPFYNFGTLDDLEITEQGLHPPGLLWSRQAAMDEAMRVREQRAARKAWEQEMIRQAEERQRAARRRAAGQAPPPALFPMRPAPPPGGPWTHCLRCGLPLDPILQDVGVHFGETVPARFHE